MTLHNTMSLTLKYKIKKKRNMTVWSKYGHYYKAEKWQTRHLNIA